MQNRFLLVLTILFLSNLVFCQGHFLTHIGLSTPLSDFKDEDKGAAALGFNAGATFIYDLFPDNNGFGLFSSIQYHNNGLQNKIKDNFREEYEIKFWRYHNIPLSVGFNYTLGTESPVKLQTNLGLVMNMLKISDFDLLIPSMKLDSFFYTKEESLKIAYNWAYKFGVQYRAGIIIKDKIFFDIQYLYLGEYELDGRITASNQNFARQYEVDGILSIGILSLNGGYKFK